jgi:hypothetical protein
MSNFELGIEGGQSFERITRPVETEAVTVLPPDLTVQGWGVERHSYSQDDTGQGDYNTRTLVEVHLDEAAARQRAELMQSKFGREEYPYSGGDFVNMSGTEFRYIGPFALRLCLLGEGVQLIDKA